MSKAKLSYNIFLGNGIMDNDDFLKIFWMNKTVLFLLMLIAPSLINAQKRVGNIEAFFSSVGFIASQKPTTQQVDGIHYDIFLKSPIDGTMIPALTNVAGTCFFIGKDFDSYLVTAEHVANDTNINTTLVLSREDQNPFELTLKELVDPKYVNGSRFSWLRHPNADVAILPLMFKIQDLCLPYELLFNRLEPPLRQRDLIVYGYPFGLGVGKKVSPISKRYSPASGLIDLARFDNGKPSTFFLIDDPSVGGLSGGPVIAMPQVIEYNDGSNIHVNGYFILGLVHGTINKDGGGYGAVVPASFIVELLDKAPSYNGLHQFRYADGKLWSEVLYKDGFPWEVISNVDHNGKPHEKGDLKNGKGTRYIYDETGKLTLVTHYNNGRIVKNDKM